MERFIPILFARSACVNFMALRREMTVLEFLQALEDVKTAEARLKDLLQEGGWLDE